MDKNCVEIFDEVLGLSVHYVKRDADDHSEGCFAKALKAMKIAMKQAFETGYYFGNRYGYTDEELTFDEWFKGLEEHQ